MKKTFIIAEAGINHNGSFDLAKKLVDEAKIAGADAVKFQTFITEDFVTINAEKAKYQKKGTLSKETQYAMLKKLELPLKEYEKLKEYCKKKTIMFLSSPFDIESARFLFNLDMKMFKIPSGEITNLPLLREIASFGKKIILSTGMCSMPEIKQAMDVFIKEGIDKQDIVVLHCNTEYPTPIEDVNLKAMLTIQAAFPGISVGYSDHTLGIEVPIAAVALGASVIEKHFTFDKNMEGPDHKASLEPDELKAMVQAIRNVDKALGNGIKKPSSSELKNIPIVRKSIVAARDIHRGEVFTEENLIVKRPGTGISPMRWDEVVGLKANRNYQEDEMINW